MNNSCLGLIRQGSAGGRDVVIRSKQSVFGMNGVDMSFVGDNMFPSGYADSEVSLRNLGKVLGQKLEM